jgi:hypothetical protein
MTGEHRFQSWLFCPSIKSNFILDKLSWSSALDMDGAKINWAASTAVKKNDILIIITKAGY